MATTPASPFGSLLRHWRGVRHMSQLALATSADVSSRHISFVETGRARPSREMVLQLSGALDVPLRERNALLQAAGYAPRYRETPLDTEQMDTAREAVSLILRHHEPFPAVAMDRHWNAVMANAPYLASLAGLLDRDLGAPCEVLPEPRPNVARLLFSSEALRRGVRNWEEVAIAVLARVERESRWTADPVAGALLEEMLAAPGAPPRSRWFAVADPPPLVIPVELESPAGPLRYITTLATLGAAQDITLQELRIEAFHPADPETADRCRALAAAVA